MRRRVAKDSADCNGLSLNLKAKPMSVPGSDDSNIVEIGAVERTRTSTALRPTAPKAVASASSATTAYGNILSRLVPEGSRSLGIRRLRTTTIINHSRKPLADGDPIG